MRTLEPDERHVIIVYPMNTLGFEQWQGVLYSKSMTGVDSEGSPVYKTDKRIFSCTQWSEEKAMNETIRQYYRVRKETI